MPIVKPKMKTMRFPTKDQRLKWTLSRVSVQGVKSLGGHFACLCRGFEFYELKKKKMVTLYLTWARVTFKNTY